MGILAKLMPGRIAESILDIDPSALAGEGVRGAILDIDNTLTAWNSSDIRPDVRAWLDRAQGELKLCLLSNSSKTGRLRRLQEALSIPVLQAFPLGKPRRKAYLAALEKTGTTPDETVMIGDQLLTDIFGANRAGLRSILVRPLGTNEFIGTKVMRLVEGLMLGMLRRRGMMPE